MRNLLTRAVFDKTFKAGDKFKEPDLVLTPSSYLYSDGEGSHFMDQETYETHTLGPDLLGNALDFLTEGLIVQIQKFNGNPIGLQMPTHVELKVTYTEPGARGDTASGNVTKPAKVETGIEIKVPLFIKEGELVKVSTETGDFAGRA
jgi:elongation factor P